jgi:hypothetical protein
MIDKKDQEKSQGQQFIKIARELGCDETGKKFEELVGRILLPKESEKSSKD